MKEINSVQTVTMGEFLFRDPTPKVRHLLTALRHEKDPDKRKEIKSKLPCATLSGTFKPGRKDAGLITHSGLICIDIDGKDNPHVDSMEELKFLIPQWFDYVCYVGLSCSGGGLFCLIPISDPTLHKMYFSFLTDEFTARGVTIDKSCGNVSRCRFKSYDPNPFFNPGCSVYDEQPAEQETPERDHAPWRTFSNEGSILTILDAIRRSNVNVTEDYRDWIRIAAALAEFGEEGREAFHEISSYDLRYDPKECDKVFSCMERHRHEIASPCFLGTVFYICRNHGVDI